MKIGLIGNMNNNNYSMMRYFRDLGADAHLLLYANDGQGSLSHFKPNCDSWEIEKWQPYIHQTTIPNAPVAALGFPYSWMMGLRSMIQSWFGINDSCVFPVSKNQIRSHYADYDCLIGSGISPAVLNRAGIDLDIFFPYSTGVEFLRTPEFLVRFSGMLGINRFILTRVAKRQRIGIQAARYVLNAEMGITHDVLVDIGIQPLNLAIPMVYDKGQLPVNPPNKVLFDAWEIIINSDFTILNQSRLRWRNPGLYSAESWVIENKNNDWLLRAFAVLIKARPNIKAKLLIVEYGPDVIATKLLATELEIDSYIHWLPKMDRRELMWLLSHVSIGVGQFYDVPRMIWGGTGWEALACGKPLLQGFNFNEGEFDQIFGYPPPPMLQVRNHTDIIQHLIDMADHPEKREEIGRGAKEWFNRHNGVGLAKKWLDILSAPKVTTNDTKGIEAFQGLHG